VIITGVDTETTGLYQEKGDKIIEICFRHYDLDTRKLVDSYVQRIHPQMAIAPAAQEVHGISIADLVGMPTWDEVAETVREHMAKADVLVAHNMAFDGPFIAMELIRVGKTVPQVQAFCTMENGRWSTPLGKKPNLGELCFALDVPYDASQAHAADYDVDVMMSCLFKGIDRGFYTLPGIVRERKEAA
jgi:DNA polymerase-3 subunit epsilon